MSSPPPPGDDGRFSWARAVIAGLALAVLVLAAAAVLLAAELAVVTLMS
jgi:hypothetical protein